MYILYTHLLISRELRRTIPTGNSTYPDSDTGKSSITHTPFHLFLSSFVFSSSILNSPTTTSLLTYPS